MVKVEVPLWMIHPNNTTGVGHNLMNNKSSNINGSNSLLKLLSGSTCRSPMYSIDVSNSNVATGGGDGCIRIWNINKLLDDNKKGCKLNVNGYESNSSSSNSNNSNANEEENQAICTLNSHTGSILCIRFSKDGKMLASGGDDHLVLVYSIVGDEWVRTHTCRGHGLDVMGICWSPDNEFVSSCSLDKDSPIIVWKINRTTVLHPHRVLGVGIQNSVKGISFDPIGTFLIGYGDKGNVCFYRCSDDWKLEKQIFKKETTSGALLKRIDCSPDGEWVCLPNMLLSGKHVAGMVSLREEDSSGASLVGHRNALVCVRYFPYFIKKNKIENDEEVEYGMLVAAGDRRGFLSVWSTEQPQPVFKLQASEARCTITDLAWASFKENLILLLSLLDGHVVTLIFTKNEIGTLLSKNVVKKIFQNKYGIQDGTIKLFQGPELIETVLQYNLESKKKRRSIKQVETRSSLSGKKRIRPVLLQQQQPQEEETSLLEDRMTFDVNQNAQTDNNTQVRKPLEDLHAATCATLSAKRPPKIITSIENNVVNSASNPSLSSNNNKLPIFSIELPYEQISSRELGELEKISLPIIANAVNNVNKFPSIILTISQSGTVTYTDVIPGSKATCISASFSFLGIATEDGTVYLYSHTCPNTQWKSGKAFRSHSPFIFSSDVILLHLSLTNLMLVICSDGTFTVHNLNQEKLLFKGTISPAINHLKSLADSSQQVKLVRAYFASLNKRESSIPPLVLILSSKTTLHTNQEQKSILQAFLYNLSMQLWNRISDSRFVHIHRRRNIPTDSTSSLLSSLDTIVSHASTTSFPFQLLLLSPPSSSNNTERVKNIVTISHLEDRMVTSLALCSVDDFLYWFTQYIQKLTLTADEHNLRYLVYCILSVDHNNITNNSQLSSWIQNAIILTQKTKTDFLLLIIMPLLLAFKKKHKILM